MPRSALLLLAALTIGCTRTPPEPAARETGERQSGAPARSAAPALSAPVESPERPFRFPAAERIVAIGDLHGDLASTREALRLAGAIDETDHWIGKTLVLVQVGDQLDRGDDEPQILQLLETLATEAARSGGAVHVLNGNHEIMNVAGDLRYVTEDGFRDYAGVSPGAKLPPNVPEQARGRAAAFRAGSDLSRKLAERNTIAIVGDTLFAHAGVLAKHLRYGIGRINDDVRRYFRGEIAALPEVVGSDDAPVWTRVFGEQSPSAEACRELEAVLSALSVKRLVVGHTVQKAGVTSACGERVFRVDVGLSDYYGKNPTQVLEIRPGGVKVLGEK
ncbi:MAG TPA: metallophosphoesterase [Polyangiaceae bacterium]